MEELQKQIDSLQSQVNALSSRGIPPHQHKTDRIQFSDLIGGVKTVSAIPTEPAEEGSMRIVGNDLYMKSNQTWVKVGATTYGGIVGSDGTAALLPTGWSSQKASTGLYNVTHSFGNTSYAVTVSLKNTDSVRGKAIIYAVDTNTFTVQTYDSANNPADATFIFTLSKVS